MKSQINRRNSVVNSYQTRCNSHLCPPLERRFIEFGTEVERRSSEGRAEDKKSRRRGREEQQKSNRRATEEQDKRQTPPKSAFGKNFFAKTLHPYTSTPHIAFTINTLQRFQISSNPTSTLHQPYTIKRVSRYLSTTCSASKYFSALIYIIFTISLGYFRKFS